MKKYKIKSLKDYPINVLGKPLLNKEDALIVTDISSNEIKNLKKQGYISIESFEVEENE